MRRADRLFQLVHALRNRKFATGEELAEALGVSLRTVYRDVRDLQYSGVPIRGEAGVGYRLERGYELPPLTFNTEELEALALGARFVAAWGDSELAASAGAAMTKIESVLPEALRPILLDAPLFAPAFGRAEGMARHMGTLRRAISDTQVVHFRYRREDGQQSERDARPLGLYFWGSKWTLAAWCELRREFRSFRPDRMEEVRLLERRFDTESGPNLAAFLAQMDLEGARGGLETPSLGRSGS